MSEQLLHSGNTVSSFCIFMKNCEQLLHSMQKLPTVFHINYIFFISQLFIVFFFNPAAGKTMHPLKDSYILNKWNERINTLTSWSFSCPFLWSLSEEVESLPLKMGASNFRLKSWAVPIIKENVKKCVYR